MFGRRSSLQTGLISALLILGTLFAGPAMVLASLPTTPGHHHHGDHGSAPSQNAPNQCCDLCLVPCSTPAGLPIGILLPPPAVREAEGRLPITGSGLRAPVTNPHRQPFPLGPPFFLA
jgi:hypothetical protein